MLKLLLNMGESVWGKLFDEVSEEEIDRLIDKERERERERER